MQHSSDAFMPSMMKQGANCTSASANSTSSSAAHNFKLFPNWEDQKSLNIKLNKLEKKQQFSSTAQFNNTVYWYIGGSQLAFWRGFLTFLSLMTPPKPFLFCPLCQSALSAICHKDPFGRQLHRSISASNRISQIFLLRKCSKGVFLLTGEQLLLWQMQEIKSHI